MEETNTDYKHRTVRDTHSMEELSVIVGTIVTVGALALLFVQPRPAIPDTRPRLTLSCDDVSVQLALDRDFAQGQPAWADTLAALDTLLEEQGVSETRGKETREQATRRTRELADAIALLPKQDAPAITRAARALAAVRFRAALQRHRLTDEAAAFMGSFRHTLRTYGLRAQDLGGASAAFIGGVLFKARWNAVFGQPLTDGLTRVERLAYWGWLGLEADAAPDRKASALRELAQLNYPRTAEAEGYNLRRVDPGAAQNAFLRGYEQTGQARLRNLALGAGQVSIASPQ